MLMMIDDFVLYHHRHRHCYRQRYRWKFRDGDVPAKKYPIPIVLLQGLRLKLANHGKGSSVENR